jgi:hypothetical protein
MTRTHAVDSTPMTHAEAAPAPTPPRPFLAARTPLALPPPSRTQRTLAPASHHVHTRGDPQPFAMVSDLFRGHHRVPAMSVTLVSFASTPATRYAPRFAPSPSMSICPRSSDLHHAAGVSPPSTRGLTTSLPPFKGPGALSQGNQRPLPLISPFLPLCVRNRSPELSYAVTEPPRRGSPPFGASTPVTCPQFCSSPLHQKYKLPTVS